MHPNANATAAAPARFSAPALLKSPLPGVSDAGWDAFVRALDVQPADAVSASGGLGSYDIRPRRLVEIGLAENFRIDREPGRRDRQGCDFKSSKLFLADPRRQLAALARSIARYHAEVASGAIQVPAGLSLSGALAILHRGGRGALAAWPDLFDDTRELLKRTERCF